ncbi:MAG: IS1634 family transposase [Muribaculaceae bacterium]|nr:IS1634 family transposase [Muribaculaceae bacterium]
MFVHKKKHRSGRISIIVMMKRNGRPREVKNFGIAMTDAEVEHKCLEAKQWIRRYGGQQELDFVSEETKQKEREETERVLSNIDSLLINGHQLILNQVYDSIGFNQIPDDILRSLVIARISQPMSKRATVDYLKHYFDEDVDLFQLYRYMDKLHNTQREEVQRISVEHTKRILGGQIGLMFYDVTTLYFETSRTDVLREPGFSKDGKTAESQIVLGLLVSRDGYPLSYCIFNGSQYEGYTIIPVIDDFIQRFALDDFVVVADAGLMSKRNVQLLEDAGYKYIIGARIHTESEDVKTWILEQEKIAGRYYERKQGEARLIVGYSEQRAKKDAYNREKGVARLQKTYASGKITKASVNKRGYNKFLEISKDVDVVISEAKIAEDAAWDGLKGYITNTNLMAEKVVEQYHGLWVVERAFRVTKGTIEARPVFHFTEKRIEAHICICFMAYKVYKELERIMRMAKMDMSVDTALKIAKTIATISINLPNNRTVKQQTLMLTPAHHKIKALFDIKAILDRGTTP